MEGSSKQEATRPRLSQVLARGLRQRCPACGKGPLFSRWMRVAERCRDCGERIAPRAGDTWGFWVLGDRLFVVIPVVLLYLGIRPPTVAWRIAVLAAIIVPLILTMPHRMGVCVGLDYLTRSRSDPDTDPRIGGAT